ncbi:MAG: oxygen-independent coproporphyrinogen III oxidase [Chloroherpetonaceae bacterium]|nr:oxygen-independent coproporphyrinogen III oxidase [Chloroherpetonaceae bacterium]
MTNLISENRHLALLHKYNTPVPRYTSYPTVPYWKSNLNETAWLQTLKKTTEAAQNGCGLSLYIHIPYCDSKCFFCGCNTVITRHHDVEKPYIDAVIAEWKIIRKALGFKPLIREVHVGGGTPTYFAIASHQRLFEALRREAVFSDEIEMSYESNPKNTTREQLEGFFELGFRRLSFGIQDFDHEVQTIINRIQPVEMVAESMRLAREVGYASINLDLVYGLPRQTQESVRKTILAVRDLRPDRIAFYAYGHNPQLYPEQNRFKNEHLPEGEEKEALYELGKMLLEEEFTGTRYNEIGMDHFALETDSLWHAAKAKKLHRNFMGYTTSSTAGVIALGASAISDAWGAFIQNEKEPNRYMAQIAEGKLPIIRGHLLNEEDLILRRHIQNLMCHFETDWVEEALQTPALDEILTRLQALQVDGLVELLNKSVRVTKLGMPFIRYICREFDERYYYSINEKNNYCRLAK